MTGLADLNATEAAAAIRRGDLKSEELVRWYLERIDTVEPGIRAFRDLVPPEEILTQARNLDSRKFRQGALYGVPIAIKEIFDVKGLRCCWGTSIHNARTPQSDAAVVAKLRGAGAIILGTTISTEYAIAAGGPTANPYDHSRTPGGSSSGSAAAVAARMVPLGLGSQTVGSVVRPAIYCGVYGFKPAHGILDTQGAMPLSPLLDHVGILADTLADIALAYGVLLPDGRPASIAAAPIKLENLKISHSIYLVENNLTQRIEPPTRTALQRARQALEAAGATVISKELSDDFDEAVSCLNTILCRDIAIHHGGDRDRAGEQMSDRMRDLVDRGRTISIEQYADAARHVEQYRKFLLDLLTGDSIILAPATDGIAPPLEEGTGAPDLQGLYSLTGLPALAVPCGTIRGLPVGVQLVAAPGREALLFAAANAICAHSNASASGIEAVSI